MANIGTVCNLQVIRKDDAGAWLDGEGLGEIFMPRGFDPKGVKTGDRADVFIFHDAEGHLVATTQRPYAVVGEFALMKAVSINPVGAFLDWGLKKDLLVPFGEQKQKMEEGKSYIVYVYLDERSGRIVASSKLGRFLDQQQGDFQEGQSVDLLICNQTEIGYKAIINNARRGVLYRNEIFQPLKKGLRIIGFIKKVRDDGKIDLCLQKPGPEKVDDVSGRIIDMLKSQDGFVSLTDKSPAEMIYTRFGVSKKTYKKAIGGLYKKRLITIESNGIRLVKNRDM